MHYDTRRNTQNFLFDRLLHDSKLDKVATDLGHNLENVNGMMFSLCSFTDYMVNRSEHTPFYESLVGAGLRNGSLSEKQWACVIKDLLKSKKATDYAIQEADTE